MNTLTAHAITASPSAHFARMQRAELEWWTTFAHGRCARQRMYALYGARYESLWSHLNNAGRIVEFGSGPMPAMLISAADSYLAVDTLMPQYIEAGIVESGIPWVATADEVPRESFDTALLLNVLDHTDDPEVLVQHAFRVLVWGGRALVFVHLDNEDDKHRPVSRADVWGWLHAAEFIVEEHALRPANEYDPAAYIAVAVK